MRSDVKWQTVLPSGAKIVAANHPTAADPFLMMSWLFEPVYTLITETAFKVLPRGQFLRLAGHIPVYAHRGREAFEAPLHLLGEGQIAGIFPEGALSEDDGQLVTARSGAVRLAVTAHVPIVPAGIAVGLAFRHRTAVATIRNNGEGVVVLAWSVGRIRREATGI